ncbi:uncharacterized protein LOC106074415 isoform X2 [Biomphalaria glabrata]|uniref:Uncharacterized protein LOC106074415 isoform X2 n=1 Tax=Biomphalaria glabrata TaxID=6526 RepID=A0A9W2YLT1_BIOGL|nr:uncharacterized protein LOC106074415 isoform X2 [Biomphalaria glabrata]
MIRYAVAYLLIFKFLLLGSLGCVFITIGSIKMKWMLCFQKCVTCTSRSSVVNSLFILLFIATCLVDYLTSTPVEPSMEDLKKKQCPAGQPNLCIPFGSCCSYFEFCYSGMCESCFYDDNETAILKFCRERGQHNVSLMRHNSCRFACQSRFTEQELRLTQTIDAGLIDLGKADKDIPKAGNLNKESSEKEDITTHKLLVALLVMTAFIILAILWKCIPKHEKKRLWSFLRTYRKKERKDPPDENSDVVELSNVDSPSKIRGKLSGAESLDVSPSDVNPSEDKPHEPMIVYPDLHNTKHNVKHHDGRRLDDKHSLAEQSVIKETGVNHPFDKKTVSKQDDAEQLADNHLGSKDNLTPEKHLNSEKEEKTLRNRSILPEVPTTNESVVDTAVTKEKKRNISKNEARKIMSSFSTDNETNTSIRVNIGEKPLLTNEITEEQEDDKSEDDENVPFLATKEAEDGDSSTQVIDKQKISSLHDISRQNDDIDASIIIRKNETKKPLSKTDETIEHEDKDIEHTADCCTQRLDAARACNCVNKRT